MTRTIEIDLVHPPDDAHKRASRAPTVVSVPVQTTTPHLQATVESVPPTVPSSPVIIVDPTTATKPKKKKKKKPAKPATLVLPVQATESPLRTPFQGQEQTNEAPLTAVPDPSTHTVVASSIDVVLQNGTSSPLPLPFS